METILSSADIDELRSAMAMLAQLQSLTPDPEELSHLGRLLRSRGCVERMCRLLENDSPDIVSHVLLVLGNLAADTIDPRGAAETKRRFHEADGIPKLLPHLFSADGTTLLYAAGAIMNASSDAQISSGLVAEGAVERLQELANGTDEQLAEFAHFALVNMREAIMHQEAEKLFQKRLVTLAAVELQSAARRWIAGKLLAQLKSERIGRRRRLRAVLILQKSARRLQRRRRRRHQMVCLIQLRARVRLARRLRRRLHFIQSLAATRIQRTYRLHAGHIEAAAVLQAVVRGERQRQQLAREHRAAWRIQIAFRNHVLWEENHAACRIQLRYRDFALRRGIQVGGIQRAFRDHAYRRREDAAAAAAALMRARPTIPRLPMHAALNRSAGGKQERSQDGDTDKSRSVVIVSPRAENVKIKGNLVLMSPRLAHFDPAAWFTTTLENTSEYTLESEREHISFSKAPAAPIDGERALSRRSSTDLEMRADDGTKRTLLAGTGALAARSGNVASHNLSTRPPSVDAALEERRRFSTPSPPRRRGCWPWGRKIRQHASAYRVSPYDM